MMIEEEIQKAGLGVVGIGEIKKPKLWSCDLGTEKQKSESWL